MTSAAIDRTFVNFLNNPLGQESHGSNRETLLKLLEIAFKDGRFPTVMKILSKDGSLVRESIGVGLNRKTVMRHAIESHMELLIPFALMRGISPDEKIFGTEKIPATLIECAVNTNSPNLLCYAISSGASIDKEPKDEKLTGALTGTANLIEVAVHKLVSHESLESTSNPSLKVSIQSSMSMALSITQSLIDFGASTGSRRKTSALPMLTTSSKCWENFPNGEIGRLYTECIKRNADIDAIVGGKALIRLALGAGNIQATIALIAAGANTDREYIGGDILEIANINGLSSSIPLISDALLKSYIKKEKSSVFNNLGSVTVVTETSSTCTNLEQRIVPTSAHDVF